MTNTEVRDLVVAVLDEIKFPYRKDLLKDDFTPPWYTEKQKCRDGIIRNTYTLYIPVGEFTDKPILGGDVYAVVDADTKKMIMTRGSGTYSPIIYNNDGTISQAEAQW